MRRGRFLAILMMIISCLLKHCYCLFILHIFWWRLNLGNFMFYLETQMGEYLELVRLLSEISG